MLEWEIFGLLVVASLYFESFSVKPNQKLFGYSLITVYNIYYVLMISFFGLYLLAFHSANSASEFFVGFIIEKMLSVDNIMVITMIFTFFDIQEKYQSRLLTFGIIGIIIFRIILIYCGVVIVEQFYWTMYIMGILLIYTGYKMWAMASSKQQKPQKSSLLSFLEGHLPIAKDVTGNQFFIFKKDKLGVKKFYFTRLFVCLLAITLFDFIFAVDSISAILSISRDVFVIYTSNVFAILGLRYLYVMITDAVKKYEYMHHSISLILVFIGSKVFIMDIFGIKKIPSILSLGIIILILAGGVIYSNMQKKVLKHR
ncbi:MAG: TerC/Alx family metal homeostasis membrane protein [Rickettsiaceae bacterium]|nr:TerC/Alx family metal homeostasis membrane protein [Rickettsiaceae bacterium]